MEASEMINPKSTLDIEMQENDAGAKTVRDYLVKLMLTLWDEGEGFSGKRPFGNSGWYYELYIALAKSGVIKAEIDEEYGDVIDFDRDTADIYIRAAIQSVW